VSYSIDISSLTTLSTKPPIQPNHKTQKTPKKLSLGYRHPPPIERGSLTSYTTNNYFTTLLLFIDISVGYAMQPINQIVHI